MSQFNCIVSFVAIDGGGSGIQEEALYSGMVYLRMNSQVFDERLVSVK